MCAGSEKWGPVTKVGGTLILEETLIGLYVGLK